MIELALGVLINFIPENWDPYKLKLKKGDEIIIKFKTTRQLEYGFKNKISRNIDLKGVSSELTKSAPKTKWTDSGNKTENGTTHIKTKWNISIPTKVVEVKENGYTVEGEINTHIDGSEEKVKISGFVPASVITSRRVVQAKDVVNLKMTYTPASSPFIIDEEDVVFEYKTNSTELTNTDGTITTNLTEVLSSSKPSEKLEKKIIISYLSKILGIILH